MPFDEVEKPTDTASKKLLVTFRVCSFILQWSIDGAQSNGYATNMSVSTWQSIISS